METIEEGTMVFELPDDSEIMAELVEAASEDWFRVSGLLKAPKALLKSGEAIEDTGFAIQRFHAIHPTIISNEVRKEPDLYAIIVERKLPGFVKFDEAGFYPVDISLELAKRIAAAYIRKGYRGHLFFYSKYEYPERIKFRLEPWLGDHRKLDESRPQYPPLIKFEWDKTSYGKKIFESIVKLIKLCQSLGLKKLDLKLKSWE